MCYNLYKAKVYYNTIHNYSAYVCHDGIFRQCLP